MAIHFWVFPTSVTHGSAAVVSKGDVTDDSTKVQISPGATCDNGNKLEYGGTTGSVVVSHGGITKVELFVRMWRSAQGADNWCLWSDDRAQDEDPFVAVGVDWGKNGFSKDDYYLPSWNTYHSGVTNYCGERVLQFHNYNTGGPTPIDAAVKKWQWNITSKATWTNALLSSLDLRVRSNDNSLAANYRSGHPRYGGAANSPRWNISQMALRVEAADPPIPFATSSFFIGD